jgi:hypothetical protein
MPSPLDVCQPNRDPASAEVLVIDTRQPDDAVTSPLRVSGQIAAFEATCRIAIFSAAGEPILDVIGMSQEGRTLAPFSAEVEFAMPGPKPACLWDYEASARDGRPIHVRRVPIMLLP